MQACAEDPTIRRIDARIANVSGFSVRNFEYYQVLRYREGQEYRTCARNPLDADARLAF